MLEVNKKSCVPLYYQLMNVILEKIELGILQEHDKLPSERELCEQYDISRSTVRQTMQELENNGYVYREHGKGTFVSSQAVKQDLLKFYSFTEEMKKIGKVPKSIVMSFEIVKTTESVAEKLKCSSNDEVYKIVRLRLADDNPMMYETTYLPVKRFPELTKEQLEANSMYDVFKKKYGVHFTKAEETFRPVHMKNHEAKMLKADVKIPSMMIERYTFENSNIIEYTVDIARGDRFEYRVVLQK
ncbi:GntR family transcriptional regulator [Clostridium massiliodielmoense]|uniref:GntR family transcriptional regulator n=1 Tax=Clostridium massiliodielmoense TaxID=1776385 RepID=UPI0001664A2E|nr:GntR family transcriptional regulator [Clostridium massiliodielmoense]EDS77012.1 transcriptional regulator, GntR family [Clostridium botulinum C str. Eklund]KEH97157.1 GntR family transcriptional regulator [Clostridium botulinum C/D str. BKT12695]NEZ50138.1 GntR family transcriptional regulator [Clostridium botulinum]